MTLLALETPQRKRKHSKSKGLKFLISFQLERMETRKMSYCDREVDGGDFQEQMGRAGVFRRT